MSSSSSSSLLNQDEYERLKNVLVKSGSNRSYDDILVLKAYFLSLDFLRNLCSNMSPKQTEDLCRNMVLDTYDFGSYVFKQGDIGEKFYIVLTGTCDIITNHRVELAHGESEYRERVVFTCKQGSHFGERALEYNEPRAASILCTQFSEIVSINKTAYIEILRLNDSFDPTALRQGSKAHIVKILAKARSKRSSLEIETCATYFERRIPFFQNFNFEQLCELARVAECISIYGKQILFKQGQIGSAFYVSLAGRVSVWVNDKHKEGHVHGNDNYSSSVKRDITDGLGKCVTILPEGTHFGERALENVDSKRMATVVSDEDLTELMIISKEDYNNLISVMLSADNMKKVTVLRKTDLFSDLDVLHLNILAKFMEAKTYKIDEVLFTAGTKAYEMIITSSGECRVELNFEQIPNQKTKKDKKHKCNLGRLGPNCVLGQYITQCGAPYIEVYHTETVIANSLLHAYTIGKNDFYQNFPTHTRDIVINKIKNMERPILPYLWDNYPKQVGADDWKRSKAWSNFRHDILNNSRKQNILENMKDMDKVKLAPNSGNIYGHTNTQANTLTNTDTKTTWTTVSASKDINVSSFGLEKTRTNTLHFDAPSFGKHKFIESALSRVDARKSANFSKTNATNTMTESGSPVSKPKFEELPFSLIHIHREPIKYEANILGFRRSLKVHMRVCGAVNACSDAKDAASGLMRNAYLTLYHGDITRESELELKWKEFSGFDSMPLHESDHFIIYCRNAPLEYSSLSPSEDLLRHKYPAFCKVKDQNFGCLSFRSINSNSNSNIIDNSISDDYDTIKDPNTVKNTFPLFLLEVSALEEVLATTTTELECKTYANNILERRAEIANFDASMLESFSYGTNNKYSRESERNTREGSRGFGASVATESTRFANNIMTNTNLNRTTCVVPMYDWFVVEDRTLSKFDISNLLLSDDKGNKNKNERSEDKGTKEYALTRSLKEYGLISENFKVKDIALGSNLEERSQILAPTFSLKVLEMEVATVSRKYSGSRRGSSRSGTSNNNDTSSNNNRNISKNVSADEEAFDDPVKKLEKIKSLIDIREHVLKLNDDLCNSELGRKKKKKNTKKVIKRNDSDSSDDEGQQVNRITKTRSPDLNKSKNSGMGLIDRRIEIFDALSSLPIKSNSTSLLNSKRSQNLFKSMSTPSIVPSSNQSTSTSNQSTTRNQEVLDNIDIDTNDNKKASMLSMKLDILEDMLNRSKYTSTL